MPPTILPFLHQVVEGRSLSAEDADRVMEVILQGHAEQAQIAGLLVALRMKGETVDEVAGFARAMRRVAEPLNVKGPLLDTCGTGGDGRATFNISTVAAFIVAGAGVRVAKHDNRSISSQCGSADVLEALGVDVTGGAQYAAAAIERVGIGFLFAPAFHGAMKHVQPVRRALQMRSVFNMLGPLTNPAGATAQLAGAWSEHAAELIAGALSRLGLTRAFVVYGHDGLDEITTTDSTTIFEVKDAKVTRRVLVPEDFGVPRADSTTLAGGDVPRNAEIARGVLNGVKGAARDIALVNAALALIAAGRTQATQEAMAMARESIDSGAAWAKLEQLAAFRPAPQSA